MSFVRLEMRIGHVYNRRKDVEQERRQHAPLAKALFHKKPPRAYPVVELHACSHTIVELTNDRDHILWYAKTGECCPEEGLVNGVVRFGKVDQACIQPPVLSTYSIHIISGVGREANINWSMVTCQGSTRLEQP